MSTWILVYSKQAQKDAKKLPEAGLKDRATILLEVMAKNPFTASPRYEKLLGNLTGFYSQRINVQHQIVYEVLADKHTVHIVRMWTRYE